MWQIDINDEGAALTAELTIRMRSLRDLQPPLIHNNRFNHVDENVISLISKTLLGELMSDSIYILLECEVPERFVIF